MPARPSGRRLAVLGSPIAHSRSPQIHLAAYRALGLSSWTYDRIECTAEQLPAMVAGFGPEWVGLSVTKPGKFAALAVATDVSERATLVGSANTLVRTETGWRADNTDIDGVTGALAYLRGERSDGKSVRGERSDGKSVRGERSDGKYGVGTRGAVLGSGGTAPAAVVALASLGVTDIAVLARNPDKAQPLVALARPLGVDIRWIELGQRAGDLDVAVNTLPADIAADIAHTIAGVPVLLDAIYDPWPTPLAAAVAAGGGRVISGLQMLLHQAVAQVEQFTGLPAPEEVMREALSGS